jgi:hypothetical protein
MTRGYLWEDLAAEVAAEFAEFCAPRWFETLSSYAKALYVHEKDEAKRERSLVRQHLEPVRNARHGNWYLRLVKANKTAAQRHDAAPCKRGRPVGSTKKQPKAITKQTARTYRWREKRERETARDS